MATRLTRREVLLGGGLVAVAAGGGAALVWQTRDDQSDPDPTPRDPSLASPTEAIASVGAAWLADHPEMADEARLRAALPQITGADAASVVDQFPAIDEAVRADFEAGDVVSVDGWLLADTEAQAAGLVHLLSG